MSKPEIKLEPTVAFLSEQIAVLNRFSGVMPYLLLKPTEDKKLKVHAQDPYGFIVMTSTSLQPLEFPYAARLDNLSYLKAILDLVHKASGRGKPAPLEFDHGMASNKTTEVIKEIRFRSGNSTAFSFKASDPFLSKSAAKIVTIADWPVEFHLNQAGIEQFDDAARTHLAGALKADDFDMFKLTIANGEIIAQFQSRAGKIDHLIGTTKSDFITESPYPISTFRSILTAMGPDGGILRVSEKALSMETETPIGLYTFVATKKIIR